MCLCVKVCVCVCTRLRFSLFVTIFTGDLLWHFKDRKCFFFRGKRSALEERYNKLCSVWKILNFRVQFVAVFLVLNRVKSEINNKRKTKLCFWLDNKLEL